MSAPAWSANAASSATPNAMSDTSRDPRTEANSLGSAAFRKVVTVMTSS